MATIPPNSELFSVHVVGDKTAKTYKDDFVTTQILSHRQQLLSDRLLREYLGGEKPADASPEAKERAGYLADINAALVGVPQFWKASGMGLDLLDDNVIVEVWNKVVSIQFEQNKKIKERTASDAERLKAAVEKGADAAKEE